MNLKALATRMLAELAAEPIVSLGKPASMEDIEECESELGIELPGLYANVLLLSGHIDFFRCMMYGLGPSAHRWGRFLGTTVMQLTVDARTEENVFLPHHLLPITHFWQQDYHCLDTSRVVNGDCPIVLFDAKIAATKQQMPKEVAPGLAEWFRYMVRFSTAHKVVYERMLIEEYPAYPETKTILTRRAKEARAEAAAQKRADRLAAKQASGRLA